MYFALHERDYAPCKERTRRRRRRTRVRTNERKAETGETADDIHKLKRKSRTRKERTLRESCRKRIKGKEAGRSDEATAQQTFIVAKASTDFHIVVTT